MARVPCEGRCRLRVHVSERNGRRWCSRAEYASGGGAPAEAPDLNSDRLGTSARQVETRKHLLIYCAG